MPSPFETEFESVAATELLTRFSSSLTLYVKGDEANQRPVSGSVTWSEPVLDTQSGRAVRQASAVTVADTEVITSLDVLLINGQHYSVSLVGEPQGGLRDVMVTLLKREKTTGARPVL